MFETDTADAAARLLARVWPSDRILLGIRISKRLREELTQHAPTVSLIQKNPLVHGVRFSRITALDYYKTLQQFPLSKIELSLMGGVEESNVVVEVLEMAAATGLICHLFMCAVAGTHKACGADGMSKNIVQLDVYNHGLADLSSTPPDCSIRSRCKIQYLRSVSCGQER